MTFIQIRHNFLHEQTNEKKTSYRGQILSRLFLAKYDRRVGFDIINCCSISVNPIRLFFLARILSENDWLKIPTTGLELSVAWVRPGRQYPIPSPFSKPNNNHVLRPVSFLPRMFKSLCGYVRSECGIRRHFLFFGSETPWRLLLTKIGKF